MFAKVPAMPSSYRPCLSILAAALLLTPFLLCIRQPVCPIRPSAKHTFWASVAMNPLLVSWTNTPSISLRQNRPPHRLHYFLYSFRPSRQLSSQHSSGYSAQQAALDHRGQAESVKIIVQILLTDSYPAYIPRPTGSARLSYGFRPASLQLLERF